MTEVRSKPYYLASLFLICACVLLMQISFTRLLSIMYFYHLAFISISLAMLGMTGGAIGVYLYERKHGQMDLGKWLTGSCYAFSAATMLALMTITSVDVQSLAALVLLITAMVLPYLIAGVAISLALTRSPCRIGLTYAADLIGASLGCLFALVLFNIFSPVNVIIVISLLGIVAGGCFSKSVGNPVFSKLLSIMGLLVCLILTQAETEVFQLITRKTSHYAVAGGAEYTDSNSYSHIALMNSRVSPYFYWGASDDAPKTPYEQRFLEIDGFAGTPMYKYPGSLEGYDFLRYDITNHAYSLRNKGDAAIIGVGGGRDIAAALHFGFTNVRVVELNPIIANLLTKIEPYASYAGVGLNPNVHIVVDDGRSWFSRTQEKFDLIQMSMVDTFAATGAGDFTFSESGLYTVEGWVHFLRALKPDGVFTLSRWYSPVNVNETGRMISVAVAALQKMGVENPRDSIYVSATPFMGTLIIRPTPFTAEDLAKLDAEAAARHYNIVARPGQPAINETIEGVLAAKTPEELMAFTKKQPLDMTPATDDRPFFFNQLKPSQFFYSIADKQISDGVIGGNLRATKAMLFIVMVSLALVVGLLVIPAYSSLKGISRPLALTGSKYFLLIGLAFMFVEIGMIQRMSVFLGHPVYSLAIVLFSLIISTGLGSLISDRFTFSSKQIVIWLVGTSSLIVLFGLFTHIPVELFQTYGLLVRASIAVVTIAGPALLMGFAFPLGLRMVNSIDERPTPWFWGMNGAAGVLGASLAVVSSMSLSITSTILIGAALYLLLLWPALQLRRLAPLK